MSPQTPRRAVYVSPLPPPAGGIGTWTRTLVSRGLPRGWTPVVVDTSPGPDRPVFERGSLASETRRAARVLARFVGALRRERPAVVHVNVDAMALGFYRDALCVLLARLARVPAVLHYRGLVSQMAARPDLRLRRAVLRRAARSASLNLVLNHASEDFIRGLVDGRSRVERVPNYYDDRALPAPDVRPRAEGEPLRALFVGALTRAKGVPEVVATAERLPDVEIHLLGSRYPETESVLAGAPANVHVHGEVAHEEVVRRMGASHVLFFPTRHGEGFPNAVCEAMALGLAVVAAPAGAIPEMVEEGRGGFLCPPEPEALAAALARLRDDDALRVAMGRWCREKAEREYAYPQVAERLVSLYESCGDTP